MPLIPEADDV
jgi:diguanylate cyclase (GGDEF)-like protein